MSCTSCGETEKRRAKRHDLCNRCYYRLIEAPKLAIKYSRKTNCRFEGCPSKITKTSKYGYCTAHRHASPEFREFKAQLDKSYRDKTKDRERQYFYTIKYKYGLTKEEYQYLRELNNDRCWICDSHQPDTTFVRKGISKNMVIDHTHGTKIVRGYLCRRCNVGLGVFGDSPEELRRAADYIEGNNLHRKKLEDYRKKST